MGATRAKQEGGEASADKDCEIVDNHLEAMKKLEDSVEHERNRRLDLDREVDKLRGDVIDSQQTTVRLQHAVLSIVKAVKRDENRAGFQIRVMKKADYDEEFSRCETGVGHLAWQFT